MANLWEIGATPRPGPDASKDDDVEKRVHTAKFGSMLLNFALDGVAGKHLASGKVNDDGEALVFGSTAVHLRAKTNWRHVARVVRNKSAHSDVWEDLVDETTPRVATEMLYDIKSGRWAHHKVLIRINTTNPVAKGAMRRCFRMKMIPFGDSDATSQELYEWADICEESVLDVIGQIGRRTLLRVRARLGLKARNWHSDVILSVGELSMCAYSQGVEHVENAFRYECHGMGVESFLQLRELLARGERNIKLWQRPSLNRMAKQYMLEDKDELSTYEEDVIMQVIVKRVCEQFNSLSPRPPKPVDMLHVGMLRIDGEDGQPVHLGYESFVQGDYHKWNTNAGWRDDENLRHTPQAFSFASFRLTKGELMVVDIQGVGDLYTDPQVHSLSRKGFGKGNLGATGMALFLRTFRFELNPVVQYLGLAPFALLEGELPTPSMAEVRKFDAGKAYLESSSWKQRLHTLNRGPNGSDVVQRLASFDLAEEEDGSEGESDRSLEDDDDERGYDEFVRQHSADSLDSRNSSPEFGRDLYFQARKLVSQPVPPVDEINAVANFLLECKKSLLPLELPRALIQKLPTAETPEASVHLALVQLYEDGEDDEALLMGDGCTIEQAVEFHLWMAALGGSLAAIERCGLDDMLFSRQNQQENQSSRRSRLNWLHVASLRGSRSCSHRALDYIDAKDTLLCIFYLQRILSCHDGRTEKERKADFEICDYEAHSLLSKAFLAIGEIDNAQKNCLQAADLALQAGDYKANMALQEEYEQLTM